MTTVGVEHHRMFIGGQPVDSQEQYEILSPATGEVVCTMAKGTVDHVDQAVASAREAFASGVWSRKAPDERSAVMKAIVERMGEEMEEFVDAEIMCNGATRRQAYGFHVGYAAPHFLHFAEEAASFTFEEAVPTVAYPTSSYNKILHEPLGVCAAIVPWNFPLLLGIWKIGPALAAGNSIVVKVDEKTPLSLLRLAQVAYDCGVPAGVFNIVSGDGVEVGARLASHPDVDKVAFTGSTPVGREIMRLASGTVKKVSLELGGKGPVIVMPDADQRIAADGALFGCILYSGQICLSGTRILVHDSIYDEFVDRLIARAKTLKVGDPEDLDTDLGPVISARQQKRILEYIESGKAEGATLALGGGVPEGHEDHGFWIEPTIFTDVTNDMKIAREEIFGPVMSVLRFSTPAEAIEIANDTDYGLTAGIWSTDYEEAQEMATKLEAGTVWINNWHMIDPNLPFGGYKQSGVGRELGPTALDEYTQTKHVHVDLTTNLERHLFDALLSTPPED